MLSITPNIECEPDGRIILKFYIGDAGLPFMYRVAEPEAFLREFQLAMELRDVRMKLIAQDTEAEAVSPAVMI